MNAPLLRYGEEHGITFTRSRPRRKSGSRWVERKDRTAVRKHAGYFRHDTEERLLLLSRLCEALCPRLNSFQPRAGGRRAAGGSGFKVDVPASTPSSPGPGSKRRCGRGPG